MRHNDDGTTRASNTGEDALEHVLKLISEFETARLRRFGVDAADANELVSDLLVEIWRDVSESKLDPETDLLKWSRYKLKYRLQDLYRRKSRNRARFAPLSEVSNHATIDGSEEERIVKKERQEELWEAVRQLSETKQQILRKRYCEGLSFRDIARDLDLTEGAARNHEWRARLKLRALLDR